jgi:hypothetical protein
MCKCTFLIFFIDKDEIMTIDEVYNHFDKSWTEVSRGTCMSLSSWRIYRMCGYIPMRQQRTIEAITQGVLKADLAHAKRAS